MRFLTFVQYTLHILSISAFLFTIRHLFSLGRVPFYVMKAFCLVAPVPLYFCNYALSDSLFASLTVVWITAGMALLHKRSVWLVAIHLLSMFLALEVKYAALVYPLVSAVLFGVVFAGRGWRIARAVTMALVPLAILLTYYSMTRRDMERATGVDTFSGFSGWSLANNSVMILPYVKPDIGEMHDPEVRTAHHFVMQFPENHYRYDAKLNTAEFMWSKDRAGKALLKYVRAQKDSDYFHAWVYAGAVWGKYGSFLVKRYPVEFARYFLLPNLAEVLYPTRIYLGPCEREVSDLFKKWYHTDLKTFSYRFDVVQWMEVPIRITILVSWILLAGALVVLVVCRPRLAFTREQYLMLWLGVLIIVAYTGFILIGQPFEHRYMINMHVLKVALPLLIFNKLYKQIRSGVSAGSVVHF
jgi:hypothetical protein